MEKPFEDVIKKEDELKELVKDISNKNNEINIIFLAMSTLNIRSIWSYSYKEDEKDYSGEYVGQLEPIVKMLVEKLAKEDNPKKIDMVYVLNTMETLKPIEIDEKYLANSEFKKYSAFTYFKERCKSFIDEDKIINIPVEKDGVLDLENALYTVSSRIQEHILSHNEIVNLYVDIHGGLRSSFTVVDAMLMLIKQINGVNLKDIYTVETDVKTNIGTIKNCKEQFKIFDFVSGINELLNFGRSTGLEKYNEGRKYNDNDLKLVDRINEISDGILLNRTSNFEDNLVELAKIIKNKHEHNDGEKGFYDTVEDLIKENYKVKINGNEYDLLKDDTKYFPAQLQWCVDKKHYQQALVLIENRTSDVLSENNILNITDEYKKLSDKGNVFVDWINLGLFQFNDNKLDYAFKEYEEHFNEIEIIGENVLNVKQSILGCIKNYSKQYYQPVTKKMKMDTLKQYKKVRSIYFTREKVNIPVNSNLLTNGKFLKDFYILLYLYKGLKKYRNTVAHPSKNSKHPNLKIEAVDAWIRLYIEQLKIVLDYKN